jgi:hypothetical protein
MAANVHVSPSGSDRTGDGSSQKPFATPQKAIDASYKEDCNLYIANGTYPGLVNAYYHRMIALHGSENDSSEVKLMGGIWAQDQVICVMQGISTPWIASRQYAIVDYSYCNILSNPNGFQIIAQEASRINQGIGNQIMGGAYGHFVASYMSNIAARSAITIPEPIAYGVFASAYKKSIIDMGDRNSTGIFGYGTTGTTGQRVYADAGSDIDYGEDLEWGGMV